MTRTRIAITTASALVFSTVGALWILDTLGGLR